MVKASQITDGKEARVNILQKRSDLTRPKKSNFRLIWKSMENGNILAGLQPYNDNFAEFCPKKLIIPALPSI